MSSFFRGLITVLFFSLVFTFIAFVFDADYWKWFWVSFFGQFIVFALFNTTLKVWSQVQVNKLKVERLNAIDKNIAPIRCAACGDLNDVYINVKYPDNNSFKCKCGITNSVLISITNAQKTDILYDTDGILTEEKIKYMINEHESQNRQNR